MALTLLAGCGVNLSTPSTNYTNTVTLQGQVFAGRNYMAGATVKIYATQPNGVATNGQYVGTAKLLATLTANTIGTWSIQGLSCSSPDQLYVTAEAGTPYPSGYTYTNLTNNPNSLMMTAIGNCSLLGSATGSDDITSIVTNEATTVAAVYALRSFISLNGTTVNITSSATNYAGASGVGVPGNYAGLAHAFLNANMLAPYKIGNFQQFTPTAPQYAGVSPTTTNAGQVPVQELNSLAYMQYLCTIGGTSSGDFSYCKQLYQLATPPNGTAPTNSLAAMLNIASYPANNADALLTFSLTPVPYCTSVANCNTLPQVSTAGVYIPAMTGFYASAPEHDWSVGIMYLSGYATPSNTTTSQGMQQPLYVALDANDTAYIVNANIASNASNVMAISNNGISLWDSTLDSTYMTAPKGIAADPSGNVWLVNGASTAGSGIVEELSASTGAVLQKFTSTAVSLYDVASDPLGNIWYTSNTKTGQNLFELVNTGSNTYTPASFAVTPASTTTTLLQVRSDANSNIWAAGYSSTTAQAVYLPNTGTAAAPTYTAGLQTVTLPSGNSSYGITTDASGNAYMVTNGSGAGQVYKISVTGSGASAVLSASALGTNPVAAADTGGFMDTDGAGNLWIPDRTTTTPLYRYVPSTTSASPFYPCNPGLTTTGTYSATTQSEVCGQSYSSKSDMAIDSTGSIWIPSYGTSALSRTTEVIGAAAPTVPLRALGKAGVMP